jgi:hypothetical protein
LTYLHNPTTFAETAPTRDGRLLKAPLCNCLYLSKVLIVLTKWDGHDLKQKALYPDVGSELIRVRVILKRIKHYQVVTIFVPSF